MQSTAAAVPIRFIPAPSGSTPVQSVSLVIPVFNEEGNLAELHRRLTQTLTQIALPYEIIFVDDGSLDGTWALINALRSANDRVIGIRHRRNLGKAKALSNGFSIAKGDAVMSFL